MQVCITMEPWSYVLEKSQQPRAAGASLSLCVLPSLFSLRTYVGAYVCTYLAAARMSLRVLPSLASLQLARNDVRVRMRFTITSAIELADASCSKASLGVVMLDDWEPAGSDSDEEPRVGGVPQPPTVGSLSSIVGGLPPAPIAGVLPEPPNVGGLLPAPSAGGLLEPPAVEIESSAGRGRGAGRGRSAGRGRGAGGGRGAGRARGLGGLLSARLKSLKRGDAMALEDRSDGGLPPAKKLKRCISDTRPDTARASEMICVWGGEVKTPVVVQPIWKELGTTWMTLSEHCGWLRRACDKRGLTHYKELFQSAVSALRRELQAGIEGMEHPDPAGELRASLNLQSDESDGDQGVGSAAADPKAACPKQANKKKCKRTPSSAKTLDVKLGDVTIRVQNKIRPFRIEVTESSVNAIMSWCREHVLQGKATLKKHQAKGETASSSTASLSWSMPVDDCPSILGKVTWQPSHTAWCVHSKDENGVIVKARVKVGGGKEQTGFLNSRMSARANYHADRRSAYLHAIELWNHRDKSTRDRIQLTTD